MWIGIRAVSVMEREFTCEGKKQICCLLLIACFQASLFYVYYDLADNYLNAMGLTYKIHWN